MVFKYNGQDPFLRAVDDTIAYYDREADGRAVTDIQRQQMRTLVNRIGLIIASPVASQPAQVAATRRMVQDLLDIAPSGPARENMRLIHNLGDIRPRRDYSLLSREQNRYMLAPSGGGQKTVANGSFVFTILASAPWEVRIGTRADGGHTAISRGANVYFAGEIVFENGSLSSWNNDSGHYHTPSELHAQVAMLLPSNRYHQRH